MDNSQCRDMLVRLYELPKTNPALETLLDKGIEIRRALVVERHQVVQWVRDQYGDGWADECEAGFAGHPIQCFIATQHNRIVGFSVYNAIALGTAGPVGVDSALRGSGVGKALFLDMLHAMHGQGYTYAVIGWVAPDTQKFFEKCVNAEVIERSAPKTGMYRGLVQGPMN